MQSQNNFEIEGYGATIKIANSIASPTPTSAFHFDQDTNFSIKGLTIEGNRTGLNATQENTAFGLSSVQNFVIKDIHYTGNYGGAGAAIAGDWWINGTIENQTLDAGGQCLDVAYIQNVRFNGFKATGADNNGNTSPTSHGLKCFSVILDPPNASNNKTGVSTLTETNGVTVTGFDVSNFDTGAYITTGKNYNFSGNVWHDNQGSGTTSKGLGMYILNNSAVSQGSPPSYITISDAFQNNGATVTGAGIMLDTNGAAAGDITTGINITGSKFIGNNGPAIAASTTAGYSDIKIAANTYVGNTTQLNANAQAIAANTEVVNYNTTGSVAASTLYAGSNTVLYGNNGGVTLPGDGTVDGKTIVSWNHTNANGETDFINAKGAGSYGGFIFYQWDGTNLTPTTVIDAAGNLRAISLLQSGVYTVAKLPAGTVTGSRASVTDATSCTFMGTLTGGGSTFCPVVYNGTAWVGG